MSISAQVWTLPDARLASCTHLSLGEIIRAARQMGMPMLGNVDQHDDTRFNRMQARIVSSEFVKLARACPVDHVSQMTAAMRTRLQR